jgi:phenylacetic acid degradation operon negative regulatory protein
MAAMTVPPAPAATPTLSRRHAAGGAGARGLLFTVLGEFVLPAGGTAWTSAFIDLLGRLGVEQKATRQALMRTAADGWLDSERIGRRTVWRLTPSAEQLLGDGARRIYSFTGAATEWDGRWVLVLVRTPESERPTRHVLRTRLSWAGLGNPAPGVWIGPHPDRVGEIEQVLADAGAPDAHVFVAGHSGFGDVRAMVRSAWDLDAIEHGYEQFLAAFSARPADDPLCDVVELVHTWRRFPWTDPVLPPTLLPAPWLGVEAAALFARLHDAWSGAARREWAALNETEDMTR